MIDDELTDQLRSLLECYNLSSFAKALLDVDTAQLDRLVACLWASPINLDARWKMQKPLLKVESFHSMPPGKPFVTCTYHHTEIPTAGEELLDAYMRDVYCRTTDIDIIRECLGVLVKEAADGVDRNKLGGLMRLTNPIMKVEGLEEIVGVFERSLRTAKAMAGRAGKVEAGLALKEETWTKLLWSPPVAHSS